MLGYSLKLKAGETASVEWSMAFNLPAGVYEVGYHVAETAGGYHDYQSRGFLLTVADDPRVKGESFVDLRLDEHRHGARAAQSFRADPILLP
ncbi:MAG: hypothetical protein ABI446_07890 [Gemmatimonadaceae bacterium]